ncbi:hypothetical protein GOP47_0006693 [Adiantum capillus-veneris]|uniref:FAD synthase n=2 Tax=Adiantum capillus-veneris TaxID=13818 RepID=A0A9D4V447_ADICA|nr:hypothetical protein GOP47_0006693 [Adiantum capillus-veneris]
MVLTSMLHAIPTAPSFGPFLELAPCRRLQRCLYLRESKIRNLMQVTSLMEKHSTDLDANGGEKLLVDGRTEGKLIAGSVVALGKFDALHIGHRALAIQASRMGPPVLLSFTGMAEVLQWAKRLPIVAPCDRQRVMSLWSMVCGGNAPVEYHLEFAKVRSLSPHDFVERLAKELLVKGVVAGANYRFGYKAAGDASDLVQLCGKFGLEVFIVDPVMDETMKLHGDVELETNSREMGQVSSTRVRKALGIGDMRRVAELLGREHRLVLTVDTSAVNSTVVHAHTSNALNQMPMDGLYSAKICWSHSGSNEIDLMTGLVRIENQHVVVNLNEGSFPTDLTGQRLLCLDLQRRVSD